MENKDSLVILNLKVKIYVGNLKNGFYYNNSTGKSINFRENIDQGQTKFFHFKSFSH